ncbi:hypothetical protein EV421DRAFT_1892501 [Armillaria borealis]|uniref:Uncharacterized protein n=1 Tax=Armillaria borealis TaxID=47425 RepID=A0AA39J4B4_9AGAR|nr:hypothetical protein EV421DRAFT_1892501 [Armillaria borealis]
MKDGVHENAPLAYHTVNGLQGVVRKKQTTIRALRLRKLNDARRLTQKRALGLQKEWMLAIGSGRVERVERLVRVGLRRGAGLKAAKKIYRPRLPSLDATRKRTVIPPIIPSPYAPLLSDIEKNVVSSFGFVEGLVLMLDELKVESRLCWDPRSNHIIGVCREHSSKTSLEFKSKEEVLLLMDGLKKEDVHVASEATVGAIGLLTGEPRLYSAHPVLLSGSCKAEKGVEHAKIIETFLQASQKSGVRTISVASDGEARRGEALIRLTFKHPLPEDSPIFPLLNRLQFMNMEVGDDDLTADKDYKHVIKRFRNLVLRDAGLVVRSVHIKPSMIRLHLASNGLSTTRINHLFEPEDRQDTASPGFIAAREALRTFGKLVRHIILPYVSHVLWWAMMPI